MASAKNDSFRRAPTTHHSACLERTKPPARAFGVACAQEVRYRFGVAQLVVTRGGLASQLVGFVEFDRR